MPEDDRDDTTTAQAPVPGRLPESEEEVPTKVTSFSAADIAKIDADYEAQRKKAAAPELDTASIIIPPPGSTKSPSVAKVPVPSAKTPPPAKPPASGSLKAVPPAPASKPKDLSPNEADEEDDSIVTVQTRPEDRADDSIVTVQKAPAAGSSVRIPVMPPVTQASPIANAPVPRPAPLPPAAPPPPTPPPRKKSDNDVYDAEEDRTERRDLPFEEIERAVSRAKLDSVSITEIGDESPTARRRAPGPYSHLPVETIASPTIKNVSDEDTNFEAETDTDVSATAKRVAKEVVAIVRAPLQSDSDVIATERRQRDELEALQEAAVGPKTTLLEGGTSTSRSGPQTTPLPLASNKPTMRFGATMPIPMQQAVAQNAPLRGSDPSIAAPPESSPRLQAVIPVVPSSGNIPVANPVGTIPPGNSQSMTPSGLHPTTTPGLGPQQPQVPRTTGSLNPPSSMQPPSVQPGAYPIGPTTYSGGRIEGVPLQNQSEPRWIVLVLAVLFVCILIPALLYVALRPRTEDTPNAVQRAPIIGVSPVKANKVLDIGKRAR